MRAGTGDSGTVRPCALVGAAVGLVAVGCADATLPVRHVAVYRNGVAYLERSGRVASSDVRFRMRESEVGDFLATLAVTERGGSSVRSAAFPIDTGGGDDGRALRTVVLSLDGAAHDLKVGYIAQAPVWKPSYRLVMGEGGDASELQVWGLVQNLSGEDWRDVRLSLVAGAPIAFTSELQTPVIPVRPTVVDRGEPVGGVPASESTPARAMAAQASVRTVPLSQHAKGPSPRPRAGDGPAAFAGDFGYTMDDGVSAALAESSAPAFETTSPEFFGGSTRYDLPRPVSIRNDSTSMVMVLSRRVNGEEVFLFAPNSKIPASAVHPFRAVRFTNDTGGELEPGPIALFERGLFLGQALLEPVPLGGSATLPFSVDRSISVEVETKADGSSAAGRLAKVAFGKLTVAVAHGTRTFYRLRNGGEQAARVLVRHGLGPGAKLDAPPEGTEERVGAGTALVPVTVTARDTAELRVDEHTEEMVATDWFGEGAGYAVRQYLADPASDRDIVRRLAVAWPLREDAVARMRERDHVRQQHYDLMQETEEIRRNLKAAGGTAGDALRAKLGGRLTQLQAQVADCEKKIASLEADIGRLTDEFKRQVMDIRMPP